MIRRRRHHRLGSRLLFDFEDEDDEVEGRIFLNPYQTTYYLGRGRFGDNSRLHRGVLRFREEEEENGDIT